MLGELFSDVGSQEASPTKHHAILHEIRGIHDFRLIVYAHRIGSWHYDIARFYYLAIPKTVKEYTGCQ